MFMEALYQLLSLNLGWYIEVTLANLFWLFGFYAAAFYFKDGKKVLGFFLILVAYMWISLDFLSVTGWVFLGAFFLFVLYVLRTALLMFLEETNFGKNNMPLVYMLYFWIWLVIFNMFLR